MEKLCVIFYLCLFRTLSAYSVITEKCLPNTETIRKLESEYGIQISELNQNITFNNGDDIVIEKIAIDVTGIYLKKVEVNFTGEKRIRLKNVGKDFPTFTAENNNDSIYANFYAENVILHRLKSHTLGQNAYDCVVIDWDNSQLRVNSPKSQFIIENLTKLCIENSICKQYDAIISHVFLHGEEKKSKINLDITNHSSSQIRGSKKTFILNSDKQSPVFCNTLASEHNYNPQNTINAMFDFAVSSVVTIFAGKYDGVMHLPHIDKDYKFAGATGEFQAFDGTFIDLRALYRVRDVVFTNEKDRFMVATSFRLAKAKLTFPRYKLRYGFIKINGNLDVDIDGITVSMKLAADYNASPCRIHLVDLTMDELGDTKVDFTGLGWPLNGAVRLAIRYIVEHKVFQVAKDIAAVKIEEINCEKFRPTLDMFNSTAKNGNVLFRESYH